MQKRGNNVVDDLIPQRGRLDRESQLDPPVKIARHPIRAGKKNPWLPGIFEIKDPAVLEKPANDADDADVVAETWNLRTQATNPAHDQIDGHICAGCFIELLNDLLVHQRVHLRNDAGRLACQRVVALPLDQFDEPTVHVERRDHQFFQSRITGEAGKRIENGRHFFAQLRFTGEQTEIGVNARGPRVIISRAEMDVTPELVGVTPNDQQRLAMRLETYHTIDHVRADFFQASRPLNVACLIKTRAQLDNRGNLFSCVSRVDERLHNGRIPACAVQRHFNGKHLRIFCRRLDQLDDFIETVIRMMQQHVLTS